MSTSRAHAPASTSTPTPRLPSTNRRAVKRGGFTFQITGLSHGIKKHSGKENVASAWQAKGRGKSILRPLVYKLCFCDAY